jgi:hypothetical protein
MHWRVEHSEIWEMAFGDVHERGEFAAFNFGLLEGKNSNFNFLAFIVQRLIVHEFIHCFKFIRKPMVPS